MSGDGATMTQNGAGCDGASDGYENHTWTTWNGIQTTRMSAHGLMMKPRFQKGHASSDYVIDSEYPYSVCK